MVTDDDHTHDALVAALRSPARSDELAGEHDAVTAMCDAMRAVPARAGARSRRGIVVVGVTVASLGVGGLAAAGPGIFSPIVDLVDRSDRGPDVTVPVDDDSPSFGSPGGPAGGAPTVPGADDVRTGGVDDDTDDTGPATARPPGAPTAPGDDGPGDDGAPEPADADDGAVDAPGDVDGDCTPGRSGDAPGQTGDRPGNGNGTPGPPASTPGQGQPPADPGPPPSTPGQGQPPADPGPPPSTPGQGQPPADPGPPPSTPGQGQPPTDPGPGGGGGNGGGGNGGNGGGGNGGGGNGGG